MEKETKEMFIIIITNILDIKGHGITMGDIELFMVGCKEEEVGAILKCF